MPELNSLRGLACLAVLFYHGLWWYISRTATGVAGFLRNSTAGGFRGVDLFFVLSGLLITNILLESREQSDYFLRFYKRRALRILPSYYMMLILLAMYGIKSKAFLLVSLFHAANMAPALGIGLVYGPLWSLAVEEQFYLIWPMLVRKFHVRLLIVLAVGAFLSSTILAVRLRDLSNEARMPIWYSAHGLALGALLAIFLRSERGTRRNATGVAATLALAGFGCLWMSGFQWRRPQMPTMLEGLGWDVLFAALLLAALLVGTSSHERFTRPKILLFLGEISYGLYLVHVLVFMTYRRVFHPGDHLRSILLQFGVCSLITVALATASRFTVEAWFLGLKDCKRVFPPSRGPAGQRSTVDNL